MHMSRILAVVLAVSLAGPQATHAQEVPQVQEYTAAQADADLVFVLHAVGEAYNAAHARLMAHPEVSLTRIYLRAGQPNLTGAERERLATMAEALAGTEAREQIMNPPLQIEPNTPPPVTTEQPETPAPASVVPIPKKPPGAPNSWRALLAFGGLFVGAGVGITALGISLVRQKDRPMEPMADKDGPCACTIVGGGFIGGGIISATVGTLLFVRAMKDRKAWQEYERKRAALTLAPSFGRSTRGTWTAGVELRF
jgi:hypothetical protein